MKKLWAVRGGAVVVVLALMIGLWQVAYARGKDEGRAEQVAIRTEFAQARQAPAAGGAANNGGTTQAGGGQPGGRGQGGAGGQGGPGGQAGQAGGFAAGRPAVVGTVEKVEDGVLYVATADGSVKVTVSEQTRIGKQVSIPVTELKAGERVSVAGEKKSDKEYGATAIQVLAGGGQ